MANNDNRDTASCSMTSHEYKVLKNHALHAKVSVSAFMRQALQAYMQVRARKFKIDFSVDPELVRTVGKDEYGDVFTRDDYKFTKLFDGE